MKTIIKTGMISIGLMIVCIIARSQAIKATYSYDANGNRLTAIVIYLTTTIQSVEIPLDKVTNNDSILKADSTNIPKGGWVPEYTDPGIGFEARIFPNPTKGLLILEISGYNEKDLITPGNMIGVWDMQGKQIIYYSLLKNYNILNLSDKPNGTYFLKFIFNKQVKEYQIIKE